MQIFTGQQINWLKEATSILFVYIPSVWTVLKVTLEQSRKVLNRIIAENSNRIRDELKLYLDEKFTAHEGSAFDRIDALEKAIRANGAGNH